MLTEQWNGNLASKNPADKWATDCHNKNKYVCDRKKQESCK